MSIEDSQSGAVGDGHDDSQAQDSQAQDSAVQAVISEPADSSVSVAENVAVSSADAANKANMHWYVVNAYSGFEFKAKQALEERIRTYNMSDLFGDIHVPQETVVELVKGQKKTSSRKFFPGYMLVQMVLNQDTWHLVKETSKISGFVGDATDPSPISDEEVNRIVHQVEEGASSPRAKMSFEQGETVKIIDGPFTDFNGTIEDVKPDKGKVKVLISIFGRATPVELDFVQVEKV